MLIFAQFSIGRDRSFRRRIALPPTAPTKGLPPALHGRRLPHRRPHVYLESIFLAAAFCHFLTSPPLQAGTQTLLGRATNPARRPEIDGFSSCYSEVARAPRTALHRAPRTVGAPPGGLKWIDFLAPQWGSARTAHHQRAAMLKRRAAPCEFSLFATFAGWGADAARHPNLSVGILANLAVGPIRQTA